MCRGFRCHQNGSSINDTIESFESCVEGLDVSKTAQVSMNGPNVNVKFLKVLQKQYEDNYLCQLIDIGTCNLL